ncbi:MAG: hypothetical protein ACFE7R_04280 [Candidatus Hodarchaeota archaeon]
MVKMEEETGKKLCEEIIADPNRGKLVFNRSGIARSPLGFLRASSPLLTAHHPLCDHFKGHTFSLRGRQWCIGCFFNSVSFAIAMVALLLIWFINPAGLSRFYLFWGGAALVMVSLLSSALHLNESTRAKALSKILLGSSFASICVSILIAGGDITAQFNAKALLIFLIYVPVITLMNAKRMYEIFRECEDCEYKTRWSRCPGFHVQVCRMIDAGYVVASDKE